MINFEQPNSTGLLRSLLLFILILFGFWILNDQGLVGIVLEGDKSHISKAIGALWFLTSIYWIYLLRYVYFERLILAGNKKNQENFSINRYLVSFRDGNDKELLLQVFEAEYAKKLSFGWMAADISLKLGLLGTVIGFILMLQPISELNDTSPEELKLALSSMSSGMAVALYTTLTGLISSILLRIQFQIITANIATLINQISFYQDEKIE